MSKETTFLPNSQVLEPSRASLDKEVNFAAQKLKTAVITRKTLFKLRRDIGKVYSRVKPCGQYLANKNSCVDVAVGQKGGIFYSGLQTCKSAWACPVCSLKISQQRAIEVRGMLENALQGGCSAMFITLTLPHSEFDSLPELLKAVNGSFRAITNNSAYKGKHRKYKGRKYLETGLKQDYDIQGFIRALEVKKGAFGWHPHLHVVFVAGCTPESFEDFAESFIQLWQHTLLNKFGRTASRAAQDWQHCNDSEGITDYITKWDIAQELTGAHKKERGGLTPFQIFEKYQQTGCEQSLKDFLHYCHTFKGVRQLSPSRGFRDKFAGGLAEMSEEEICKDEKIIQLLLSLEKTVFKSLVVQGKESDFINLIEGMIKEDSFNYEEIEVFLHENSTLLLTCDWSGDVPIYKALF